MSGMDEEPEIEGVTAEELEVAARAAIGSVNEALLNAFRLLGPPPGIPSDDEPKG